MCSHYSWSYIEVVNKLNVYQISYFYQKANEFEIESAEIAMATGLGGLGGAETGGGQSGDKTMTPKQRPRRRQRDPNRPTISADAPIGDLQRWIGQAFGGKMGLYTKG